MLFIDIWSNVPINHSFVPMLSARLEREDLHNNNFVLPKMKVNTGNNVERQFDRRVMELLVPHGYIDFQCCKNIQFVLNNGFTLHPSKQNREQFY